MKKRLRRAVWKRAANRCEYCLFPHGKVPVTFEVDHIIAKSHGGWTTFANLALACYFCNHCKGTNVAGIDPKTKKATLLFNPRKQNWDRHFVLIGPLLKGKTAVGRTTVAVLRLNRPLLVGFRQTLIEEGAFPTSND